MNVYLNFIKTPCILSIYRMAFSLFRFVEGCSMSDILEIVSSLVEVFRQETSNRSTPLSHIGKSPLYFVLLNKVS